MRRLTVLSLERLHHLIMSSSNVGWLSIRQQQEHVWYDTVVSMNALVLKDHEAFMLHEATGITLEVKET